MFGFNACHSAAKKHNHKFVTLSQTSSFEDAPAATSNQLCGESLHNDNTSINATTTTTTATHSLIALPAASSAPTARSHCPSDMVISSTASEACKMCSNTSRSLLISLIVLIFICTLEFDLIRGAFEDGNNNNVKITKQSLELTQTINVQRQEYLQKQCELMGYSARTLDDLTDLQMEHMFVDHQHKFLYCYVPKVACTNWKRVLMILTGKWTNGTDPLAIPGGTAHSNGIFQKFNTLSDEEKQRVFADDYTRFVFVRHPFERLLSAYRNKLEDHSLSASYFQKRIGRQIIKAFRVNASNESLTNADDVTFGEFVQYLLTPELSQSNQSAYNEHWDPIANLCNPCVMKYNVLGKYETLLDDSSLTLSLIGGNNLTFPSGHKPMNTRAYLRYYFDSIPIGAIRRLYDIYIDDFRLFDYGLDDVLGFEFG